MLLTTNHSTIWQMFACDESWSDSLLLLDGKDEEKQEEEDSSDSISNSSTNENSAERETTPPRECIEEATPYTFIHNTPHMTVIYMTCSSPNYDITWLCKSKVRVYSCTKSISLFILASSSPCHYTFRPFLR